MESGDWLPGEVLGINDCGAEEFVSARGVELVAVPGQGTRVGDACDSSEAIGWGAHALGLESKVILFGIGVGGNCCG